MVIPVEIKFKEDDVKARDLDLIVGGSHSLTPDFDAMYPEISFEAELNAWAKMGGLIVLDVRYTGLKNDREVVMATQYLAGKIAYNLGYRFNEYSRIDEPDDPEGSLMYKGFSNFDERGNSQN